MLSVLCFLGLAAFLLACDARFRAVPRFACVAGTALGLALAPSWGVWLGVPLGVAVGWLADLPAGDVAVAGMLGAWLGVEGTIVVWTAALLGAHVVWIGWEAGMVRWPGDWPFTPFLLVPACAMVWVTTGG